MSATLEVLFAPAEFEALPRRDLSGCGQDGYTQIE